MIRKILSFGFMEAVARGFNWLLLIVLPFLLSPSEYGIIGLIVAAEGLIVTVALIGQDRSLMRFFNSSDFEQSELVGSIVWILMGSSALIFVAVGIAHVSGVQSIGGIPVTPHAWVLALLVAGSLILRFNWAFARVADSPSHFLVSRVAVGIAKFGVVILLAVAWKDSLSYPAGGAIVTIVGGMLLLFWWPVVRLGGTRRVTRQLLIFGWPFVFHAVSANLLMVADRFMIEGFLDEQSVGIYTFAYAVGASLSFVFGSMVIFVEPQIYKAADNDLRATRLLNLFLATSSIGGILVGLILVAVSGPLIVAYLAPDYGPAVEIIPWVVGAHILSPIYLMSTYRLTNSRKTSLIAVSSGVSALINIGLNLFLIPRHGILGAAIATFVSYIFLSAIITAFSGGVKAIGRITMAMIGLATIAATSVVLAGASLTGFAIPMLAVVALALLAYKQNLKKG